MQYILLDSLYSIPTDSQKQPELDSSRRWFALSEYGLRNDLRRVGRNVKHYSLTHSLTVRVKITKTAQNQKGPCECRKRPMCQAQHGPKMTEVAHVKFKMAQAQTTADDVMRVSVGDITAGLRWR